MIARDAVAEDIFTLMINAFTFFDGPLVGFYVTFWCAMPLLSRYIMTCKRRWK